MKMGTAPTVGITHNYWHTLQTNCNTEANKPKKSYDNMVFLNINPSQTPVSAAFKQSTNYNYSFSPSLNETTEIVDNIVQTISSDNTTTTTTTTTTPTTTTTYTNIETTDHGRTFILGKINDNLLYPIRDTYNPYNNTFDLLDRCVIDRRIHISPPGETTQYKINEIYHNVELNEKESYILAIKYAIDICTNNTPINSDILLFCTTSTNIIKLVDELNKVLPSNTIAIPYYGDLPEESKTLISNNLDQFKKKIKFERKYIHDVLNNKKKLEQINSNYIYEILCDKYFSLKATFRSIGLV
jgi:hypothetical protein